MNKIEGILPVLVTPLRKNKALDRPALARIVNWLIDKRVAGFWVLGTGSEDMSFGMDDRWRVVRTVVEANAGRVPLIVGASFYNVEDTIVFMENTAGWDFDAYHVIPYHRLLSSHQLTEYYKYLADNAKKPLFLYTSKNWSAAITPKFVEGLKAHGNIVGIKYSSRDVVELAEVISMEDDNFQVITADTRQLYACLCLGSQAHTTTFASAFPEPLVEIYEYFQRWWTLANGAQNKLNKAIQPLAKCAKQHNFLGSAEEKYFLYKRGFCEPFMSAPFCEVWENLEHVEIADQVFEELISAYDPHRNAK